MGVLLSYRSISFIVFVSILLYYLNINSRLTEIQDHLLRHKAKFIHDMITQDEADFLLKTAKSMKEFPSNNQDLEFYDTVYEHIGEAEKISDNGKCDNQFLVPNKNRTLCVLPGRVDIARHYMMYGGIEGMKESFLDLFSRIQSFGRYIFDINQYPEIRNIFLSPRLLKEAMEICPDNKQVLDPFQFNIFIQVPGQTIPYHIDAVYFEDATRFQYPQWLLAVMQSSGLYQDKAIDQIQVVTYFHDWNSTERGGQFLYHMENGMEPRMEQPFSKAGSMIDGAKVVHTATVYHPTHKPPFLNTANNNRITYQGNDEWAVLVDGKEIARYKTNDLRMTVIFRARCFETESKKDHFLKWYKTHDNVVPIEDIIDNLTSNLVKTRGYEKSYFENISRLELATILLDEYIKYPLPPNAIIPYNYCMIGKYFPILKPILNFVC